MDGSTRQLTVLTATAPQDMDKSQCSPSNDSITNSSQPINQTQQPVHPLTPSSCLAIRRPTTNMLVFFPFILFFQFFYFKCFSLILSMDGFDFFNSLIRWTVDYCMLLTNHRVLLVYWSNWCMEWSRLIENIDGLKFKSLFLVSCMSSPIHW